MTPRELREVDGLEGRVIGCYIRVCGGCTYKIRVTNWAVKCPDEHIRQHSLASSFTLTFEWGHRRRNCL